VIGRRVPADGRLEIDVAQVPSRSQDLLHHHLEWRSQMVTVPGLVDPSLSHLR